MLKSIRIVIALLSIVAVTLLFVDFTGTASSLWPWMAQIQFIPALLSLNLVAIALLLVLTLIFGRVYCSVICPLGILQDVANWVRGHVGPKKKRINRFKYSPGWVKTRLTVMTAFIVLLIFGLLTGLSLSVASLIEPFSEYGRIATSLFAPVVDGCNNLLAAWSESQVDNYMFYRVVPAVSIPVIIVAIITLVIVLVMAWRGGRDYCNMVCPVGTFLGYISKFSILKPVINTNACINCGKCARNCKAKCINAKEHAIDYTRCVACMDCISTCQEGAIKYAYRRPQKHEEPAPTADKSRRGFVAATGLIAGALAFNAVGKADGGLTPLKKKKGCDRKVAIVPAGSHSLRNFTSRCSACQVCIQSCDYEVLKPSTSLDSFMQPYLDFTHGYCHTDCNECSKICPAGAIYPIEIAEKSAIKIGNAFVDVDRCLSATEGVKCLACSSHCPAGAIKLVPVEEGSELRRPVVNEEICIGCGACEYYCPVGTLEGMDSDCSAIHVEGIEVHREC